MQDKRGRRHSSHSLGGQCQVGGALALGTEDSKVPSGGMKCCSGSDGGGGSTALSRWLSTLATVPPKLSPLPPPLLPPQKPLPVVEYEDVAPALLLPPYVPSANSVKLSTQVGGARCGRSVWGAILCVW